MLLRLAPGACVFDPARPGAVRSPALNVYPPCWRSALARRLALLEVEDSASPSAGQTAAGAT